MRGFFQYLHLFFDKNSFIFSILHEARKKYISLKSVPDERARRLWADKGWVNVGTDHDTSEFAVENIRRWWNKMGKEYYPKAKELLITADGGGSNGYRVRLWKISLQYFSDETGLKIFVCHFHARQSSDVVLPSSCIFPPMAWSVKSPPPEANFASTQPMGSLSLKL